jgi:threonine/homoserine/homoserine lactone efflux protein
VNHFRRTVRPVPEPATLLLFVAFLPQFVDPGAGSIGAWLRGRPALMRGRRWITGGVYLVLAGAAVLAGGRRRPA